MKNRNFQRTSVKLVLSIVTGLCGLLCMSITIDQSKPQNFSQLAFEYFMDSIVSQRTDLDKLCMKYDSTLSGGASFFFVYLAEYNREIGQLPKDSLLILDSLDKRYDLRQKKRRLIDKVKYNDRFASCLRCRLSKKMYHIIVTSPSTFFNKEYIHIELTSREYIERYILAFDKNKKCVVRYHHAMIY